MNMLLALLFSVSAHAAKTTPAAVDGAREPTCTVETEITDVIGPASVDWLKRTMKYAEREQCASILLLINTPGGSLESTRIMVEMILNSPKPFLCLVSPSGAHAGSAGAIILQACHVAGGVPGTNLGAATPVGMGDDLPKDLRQKILNDTRSWLESLTRLRGRSEKFGQDIIMEAKAVTAEDALKLKAIDFVGNKTAFLAFADGREVKIDDSKIARLRTGDLRHFEFDLRHKSLRLLTDPQLAYMLLMGSLALLYFEVTHPGTMIAGVVGGVGLIVAMIALHKLDVEWGGLALIFLGICMLIAEMFVPSFGALGIGGIVAFVMGSVFLFDPVKSFGYRLPLTLIAPVAILLVIVFVGVSLLVLKTRNVRKRGGYEDLMGLAGMVVSVESSSAGHAGYIELRGELWKFRAEQPVQVDSRVLVSGNDGLILKVKKEES